MPRFKNKKKMVQSAVVQRCSPLSFEPHASQFLKYPATIIGLDSCIAFDFASVDTCLATPRQIPVQNAQPVIGLMSYDFFWWCFWCWPTGLPSQLDHPSAEHVIEWAAVCEQGAPRGQTRGPGPVHAAPHHGHGRHHLQPLVSKGPPEEHNRKVFSWYLKDQNLTKLSGETG